MFNPDFSSSKINKIINQLKCFEQTESMKHFMEQLSISFLHLYETILISSFIDTGGSASAL